MRRIVQRFEARDTASADETLGVIYGSRLKAEFKRLDCDFALQFTALSIGSLRLTETEVSGQFRCSRVIEDYLQILVPFYGKVAQSTSGSETIFATRSVGSVVRPGEQTTHQSEDGKALMLSIPLTKLAARIEMLTARQVPASMPAGLGSSLDLREPMAAAFARGIRTAFLETMHADRYGLGAVVAEPYEEVLLSLAVPALLPECAAAMAIPPSEANRSAITEARDYIAANATEPIELSKLAARLNIGMRTFQVSFQKRFGLSPRDFILECRLNKARSMFLSGDRSSSVMHVALECGFANLSHFAAKYRDKFGEVPSETLRLARLAAPRRR